MESIRGVAQAEPAVCPFLAPYTRVGIFGLGFLLASLRPVISGI